MAAVLCKGIGEICILPCRLCVSSCKACSDVCGGACEGCGHMCQNLCSNPFCTLVTVALITQVPVIFLFFPEIGGLPDCEGSVWLLVNAVLAIINIFTAFYLAYRIVDVDNPRMAHLDTAFKRASYLVCHDVWMAIYICIFIGFICVQGWGSVASFDATFLKDDEELDDNDACSDSVDRMVNISSILGWFYVFLGFFALMFSMCCASFNMNDYSARPNSANSNHQTGQSQNSQNQNATTPPPYYASTGYSQQGAPSNDFQQQPAAASATYTKDGAPTTDYPSNGAGKHSSRPSPMAPQEDIPMAYAEEIPHHASAPPQEYDSNHPSYQHTKQASAGDQSKDGTFGGTAGKKIEETGKKAGEALGKGFLTAKNFVQSKMAKHDDKTKKGPK
eukprot:scaffold925_cov129-Cylindrotheca_fusiformis.AAC.40